MNLNQICEIAESGPVRMVFSYSGANKFAFGISDGVTTPIVVNGTPEEIETALARQLPEYRQKVAEEAAARKAKEDEVKRQAAEQTALAELRRQENEKKTADKKIAAVNKESQLELCFE